MQINLQLQRVSNLLTRQIAIRYGGSIPIYPLVEYPKSGGTWVCRMLAECLQLPFAQYSRLPVAMPCIVHGHWKYHPQLQNVTYLLRDGRDVVVSYYFHSTRLSDNPNETHRENRIERMHRLLGPKADLSDIRKHLPRYIEHIFSNPIGCRQNWSDHLKAWNNRPGVSYVRYEDLREDCVAAMDRLLRSLGSAVDKEVVVRAVDRYSMQSMTGRRPGEEDSSSFIRKGIVGDWRNHFSREAADVFDHVAGDTLIHHGYEPDRRWIAECEA